MKEGECMQLYYLFERHIINGTYEGATPVEGGCISYAGKHIVEVKESALSAIFFASSNDILLIKLHDESDWSFSDINRRLFFSRTEAECAAKELWKNRNSEEYPEYYRYGERVPEWAIFSFNPCYGDPLKPDTIGKEHFLKSIVEETPGHFVYETTDGYKFEYPIFTNQ